MGLGVVQGEALRSFTVNIIIGHHDEDVAEALTCSMLNADDTVLVLRLGRNWKGSWEDGGQEKRRMSACSHGKMYV